MSLTSSGLTLTWVTVLLLFLLAVGMWAAVRTRAARRSRTLTLANHEEILEALHDIRGVLADSFSAHEQTVQTLTEIRDREDTP